MKAIGEVLEGLADGIGTGRMPPGSSTDGPGAAKRQGQAHDGSPGDPSAPRPRRGAGDPDCPRCHGIGWLRRDVGVDDPGFGRAVPCDCIAHALADRRLDGVRRASNIAALGEMTFEAFTTRAPGNSPDALGTLESAFLAARAFAQAPEGWLVLHGGFGSGKTHLAAAIVNARLAAGDPALFVVVPDLLDNLRAAYAPGAEEGYDARFEAVRNAPLLVLDDLGTQAPTAWAGEKLFQLLNHRYNLRLPTVITTNHDPEALDERIRSRLGHFDLVRVLEIRALDYRGGLSPGQTDLSSLHLYGEATFQTWDARAGELPAAQVENLARGYGLARDFAGAPAGWLVLLGDHGSGKTHLAAAIAHATVASGAAAMFVVVPDLLDHLRATFSPTSRVGYDQRFEEVRTVPLLVLDDLGTETATPWAQEKLFQLLNHRYVAQLPTVLTTSRALVEIHPRLRARMLDRRRCVVFELLAPAYHGSAGEARGGRGARGGGGRRR